MPENSWPRFCQHSHVFHSFWVVGGCCARFVFLCPKMCPKKVRPHFCQPSNVFCIFLVVRGVLCPKIYFGAILARGAPRGHTGGWHREGIPRVDPPTPTKLLEGGVPLLCHRVLMRARHRQGVPLSNRRTFTTIGPDDDTETKKNQKKSGTAGPKKHDHGKF